MTTDSWVAGADLPAQRMPPISRTVLALFAGASGDHNPVHIDIDAAREAGLDDVIAHGMLSMAYLGRYLTQHLDQRDLLSFEVRFDAITPVHAIPTCRATVASIGGDAGRPFADLDLVAALDDGPVTLRGRARTALPTRPALHREETP